MTRLEENGLYRFAKVLWVLGYMVSILLVAFLAYLEKPYEAINRENSFINCNNGSKYSLDELNIFYIPESNILQNNPDEIARKACAYQIKEDYAKEYPEVSKVNYTVSKATTIEGSWTEVATIWILGVAIVCGIFWLIKETFLYIVSGKKFGV